MHIVLVLKLVFTNTFLNITEFKGFELTNIRMLEEHENKVEVRLIQGYAICNNLWKSRGQKYMRRKWKAPHC